MQDDKEVNVDELLDHVSNSSIVVFTLYTSHVLMLGVPDLNFCVGS